LKPQNLFLCHDAKGIKLKILDFGIAKLVGLDGALRKFTQGGVLLGRPQYLSPEQIVGDEVDHRTDVYTVGSIIYEMFSGRPPFSGDPEEIFSRKVKEVAPRLQGLDPSLEVPPGVGEVVAKALRQEPSRRHGTIGEFWTDLSSAARSRRFTPPPEHVNNV